METPATRATSWILAMDSDSFVLVRLVRCFLLRWCGVRPGELIRPGAVRPRMSGAVPRLRLQGQGSMPW